MFPLPLARKAGHEVIAGPGGFKGNGGPTTARAPSITARQIEDMRSN
jgi:hypothetical protein